MARVAGPRRRGAGRPGLSLRAYAAHRRAQGLPGGALQAVQRAVDRGLPRRPDGTIDPAVADPWWAANMRTRGNDAAASAAASASAGTYGQARALREAYLARLAKLEYERKSGELIPTAEAEATYSAQIIRARTKLLAIPSQLKRRRPHVTAEDLADLDALIREALQELASGTGEAVA